MIEIYQNEEHKRRVIERGDGYEYIGTYKYKEVTLDGKNKKHNGIYIRVKCPYCGSEYDVRLESFTGKKKSKCPNCCNSYEKSFAYYIQQELKEPLNKYWAWEENNKLGINPYLATYQSNKKVYIKCDKVDYHGSYLTSLNNFYNGNRCPYCNSFASHKVHPKDSFAQWLIDTYGEDAIKKYWSDKNTLDPFKLSPQSNKNVWLYCQEKDYHNDNGGYFIRISSFYSGSRCGFCHTSKTHPKDSFGSLYPEKAKYWSKNNNKSPYEVFPYSNKKYKFICEECGKEFERSLLHLNQTDIGVFCKECNSSQLETKTKNVLKDYNIDYKTQVEYEDLLGLGNGNLSYDFYLPDYNLLIECQGEQHERFVKGFHETKKDFEKQLEHDKRKKQYAKEHNINLLEIWYYDIDNIEDILLEKLNLNNKNN